MVVGKKPQSKKKPQELWVKSKSYFSVVFNGFIEDCYLRNITMTKTGKIDSFSETYLYIYVLKIFT